MNKTTILAGLLIGFVQLASVQTAQAGTTTFGDTPVDYTSSDLFFDGFKFSTSYVHTVTSDAYGSSNGSQALAYYAVGNNFETFSMADSTLFNLTKLDLGGWAYFGQGPQTLSVIGTQAGGGTVTATLNVAPTSFNTYTLTGFTNLQSVQLGSLPRGYVAVDNIVTTPVPEPETYALMLAGLGLLAVVRRRRQTQG